MANYITTESDLTQVANAIRAKGNTSAQLEYPDDFVTAIQNIPAPGVIQEDGQGNITLPETGDALVISQLTVTENGTYTASETAGYNPVIVNVQPPDIEEKDVNFIDYDGTIVYSYTAAEFANLTAMPDNPTHDGLVSQGWNWTLSDAKTYVAKYGELIIGQLYATELNQYNQSITKIYIELTDQNLSPYFGVAVNGTAYINFGDSGGWYSVTGTSWFSESDVISTQHTYAAPGKYCISVTGNAHGFYGYSNTYGSEMLWNNNKTSSYENRRYQMAIKKIEMGQSYVNLDSKALCNCSNLETITQCSGRSDNYNFMDYGFHNCYNLKGLVIPSTSSSGTIHLLDSLFNSCYGLKYVALPNQTTFYGTRIFYNCHHLRKISIPEGTPNATTIPNYSFYQCYNLHSINIPSNITNIGSYAFANCYGLNFIKFYSQTPPTLADGYAFYNLPTNCVIFVPGDTLATIRDYYDGTNYPNRDNYKYIGYATFASGATLPTLDSGLTQAVWYATKEEAINNSGTALSTGNGHEIYCHVIPLDDEL